MQLINNRCKIELIELNNYDKKKTRLETVTLITDIHLLKVKF